MKEYLKKHLINIRGKRISERVLIIESDDWGSIRIPDIQTQSYISDEKLINLNDPFSRLDCLESEEDYLALYEILLKHRDSSGNYPVITANMVMANPDFIKIKKNQFDQFYYESFADTYKKYYPNQSTFDALMSGLEQKLLFPQFHAREHLNVFQWMNRLQSGDERFIKAFEKNCFAINDTSSENHRSNLMASYDYQTEEEHNFIQNSIKEGLQMFEHVFGFPSKTSIAPCYVWNEQIENDFAASGVMGIQSSYIQQKNNKGEHVRIWQKMGNSNKLNQKYFIRNVLFEPSLSNKIKWVDKAMESIAVAFFWGKPAIIGSHRINYVAGLSSENRNNTLKLLDELLKRVIQKWPDIKFINSQQLLEQYN